MKKEKQTVVVVTAYGEDNYYQKRYEDVVGIYTSVDKAIRGAMEDGMTNSQKDYLDRINAFYFLLKSIQNHLSDSWQVDYWEEEDARRKPITSAYMFRTYDLD